MEKAALEERPSLVIVRNSVPHSVPELPRLSGESLVTVILRPVDGGTELEFRQEPIFDESARGGWNGALDRLAQLLQDE